MVSWLDPSASHPYTGTMTSPQETAAKIIATKNLFTATFDSQGEAGEWQKNFRGVLWERQRKFRANRIVPAVVRAVVYPQKSALEWHGPAFVVGKGAGTARQRLTLTETETRERSFFSQKIGGLLGKSWQLTLSSEVHEMPEELIARSLTREEQAEHAHFGGSREPAMVMDMEPDINLVLGYTSSWYIREGSELSPKLDPGGQIGQIVLDNFYETSQRLLTQGGTQEV